MMMLGRFVSLLARPFVRVSNWHWENRRCGNVLCHHLRKQHFSFAGFCQAGQYSPGDTPCRCRAYVSARHPRK
jgi:hypothetical protein